MRSRFLLLFLFLVLSTSLASGGAEDKINDALSHSDSVHLKSGTYLLDGTILLKSGQSLIGESGTILKVNPKGSQWAVGSTGIISAPGASNILIENIEIDGSCDELPRSYANYDGIHDAFRGILVRGYSNQFSENIIIRNCWIYNCFSDAVHVRFSKNVIVDNVKASNCQHSSVYFICVIGGLIQNCEILGITSDDVRVESSRGVKVLHSTLAGYFGNENNGAHEGGHNLIQVGNQGHSKGAGSPKPVQTEDIEIAYNIFSGRHLNTIWVDAAGLEPTKNLYVHDNEFVDMPELERAGFSVENLPSVQESVSVFDSILAKYKRSASVQYPNIKADLNGQAFVIEYLNERNPHSIVEVYGEGLTAIEYTYDGQTSVYYIEQEVWDGTAPHIGKDLFVPGKLDQNKLRVKVVSGLGYQYISDVQVTTVADMEKAFWAPEVWLFISIVLVLGAGINFLVRKVIM